MLVTNQLSFVGVSPCLRFSYVQVSFREVSFSKDVATVVDPKWYELHKCEKLEVDIGKPKAKPKADKK